MNSNDEWKTFQQRLRYVNVIDKVDLWRLFETLRQREFNRIRDWKILLEVIDVDKSFSFEQSHCAIRRWQWKLTMFDFTLRMSLWSRYFCVEKENENENWEHFFLNFFRFVKVWSKFKHYKEWEISLSWMSNVKSCNVWKLKSNFLFLFHFIVLSSKFIIFSLIIVKFN